MQSAAIDLNPNSTRCHGSFLSSLSLCLQSSSWWVVEQVSVPVRMTNRQNAMDRAATCGSRSYRCVEVVDGAVERGVRGRTRDARFTTGWSISFIIGIYCFVAVFFFGYIYAMMVILSRHYWHSRDDERSWLHVHLHEARIHMPPMPMICVDENDVTTP